MASGSSRIDVSIEQKSQAQPETGGKRHPNTCPSCGSHYRDDELEANLGVCPHCGHHFPVPARARIEQLADEGSFVEEAADIRSDDPLDFYDLRPYTERLAEAELATGLGEAIVIGRGEALEKRLDSYSHRWRRIQNGVTRFDADAASDLGSTLPHVVASQRLSLPMGRRRSIRQELRRRDARAAVLPKSGERPTAQAAA